jgi:hypothetical protein
MLIQDLQRVKKKIDIIRKRMVKNFKSLIKKKQINLLMSFNNKKQNLHKKVSKEL